MAKRFIFIWMMLGACSSLLAQDRIRDSLQQLLQTSLADTSRIKVWSELGRKICGAGDYNKAIELTENAISFGEKNSKNYHSVKDKKLLNVFKKEIGNAYSIKGISLWYLGNYPLALEAHLNALKNREEAGDKKGMSASYNNIGIIYNNQGNNPDALKNYIAALQIALELNDIDKIASFYNNIGNVYAKQKNFKHALNYQQKALKLYEELNDKYSLAITYGIIGAIHYDCKKNDSALKAYNTALQLREELGDQKGIGITYINMSGVYIALNQNDKAISFLDKGIKIAKEFGLKEWLSSAYLNLSFAYDHMGKSAKSKYWEKALECYKTHIAYRDSLVNEANTKKTVQAQMNYEFEKKEAVTKAEQDKKDILAAEEKGKQKIIIASVSVGLFLVLILAIVIFRSLRQNQKKNKIITEQKKIVEKQKELVEEKQKEILDSIYYARRIQRALITPEKYIESSLKRLIS